VATYDEHATVDGVQSIVNMLIMAKIESLAKGLRAVRDELDDLHGGSGDSENRSGVTCEGDGGRDKEDSECDSELIWERVK